MTRARSRAVSRKAKGLRLETRRTADGLPAQRRDRDQRRQHRLRGFLREAPEVGEHGGSLSRSAAKMMDVDAGTAIRVGGQRRMFQPVGERQPLAQQQGQREDQAIALLDWHGAKVSG